MKSVEPYKIKPQQCKKCFRFGHWADACTRQQVCSNCGAEGGNHGSDCRLPPKCCLCQGDHNATDTICPRWKKQLEICTIRTEHQVGYKQAADIYQRKHSTQPMSAVGESWGPPLNSDSERIVIPNKFERSNQKTYRQAFLDPRSFKTSTTCSESSDEGVNAHLPHSGRKMRKVLAASSKQQRAISQQNQMANNAILTREEKKKNTLEKHINQMIM